MSTSKLVVIYNEITGKWSKLRVEANEDGTLSLDRVAAEMKKRRHARGEDDEDDITAENLEQVKIPEGVDYIVPVVSIEEAKELKKQRRERRLKRQLSIKMKF